MKIIFLDIDGVMNNLESLRFPRTKIDGSKHSYSTAHPSCIEALNHLIAETEAWIVVSSTWRGIGVKMLRKIFSAWGIKGKTIGRTPDKGSSLWERPERGLEIAAWLKAHPDVESFVILDDGDDMAHLKQHLVQADYEVGLTMADAKRAIALLNERARVAA
jgi:hypothetical protein